MNPTYTLSVQDRLILGVMAEIGLWSKQRLAREFGVSRKTVLVCQQRWRERYNGR